ncbi:MAG: tRNA lysidine(34) synthetase TilS, partial [Lautropia sp.]
MPSPETAFSPEKALLDALTRAGLGSGQRVLLACSGGRDSQVLMHVAAVLRPAVRPVVAHVHHGLQPHADDWLQFCADEARVLGLRFLARRLDPATRPPLQRPGSLSGLEAWAREGRYRALADMAAAVGARVVITAHHANDQLETVEMRRRRGSGVLGLAGMREQAPLPHAPAGYRLLRPFLSLSRAQLAHWAETHGLQWVEDPSNQDLRFTRNRIRDALDRQLQDEPQALPGGLAAVGLFQQAADRLLAQAAADVAAATVHVTPRAGRRTGLPAGVPQGLLVAAAPVQATPPDSSLDLTMLLDAPLTVDLASAEAEAEAEAEAGAEAGAGAGAGAGAESGTSTGAGDALPLARPSLVDGSVPGEGLPPAMVLMPPPAAPLLLSRAALMRLDSARRAEALRYWLAALGCRMPSRHKLAEIERQLLLAASSQAIVHHDGIGLLRYRDHIGRLPEVAPIMPTRFQWQGERFIDLPSGRLYIDPVPPGGEERWREVPEALEAAGQEAAMQESAMQESAMQESAMQ